MIRVAVQRSSICPKGVTSRKDHLSSTHAVVNTGGTVVEAHDYAAGIPSGLPVWAADEIREGFHPESCLDGNALAGMPERIYQGRYK